MAKLFDAITAASETTAQVIKDYLDGKTGTLAQDINTVRGELTQDIAAVSDNVNQLATDTEADLSRRDRVVNLLVNSCFVNPVNQQMQTSYSGSNYMIDCWKGAPCELAVGTESVSISRGSVSYGIFAQFAPQLTAGKTYTLAAKNAAGEIAKLTFVPQVGMANMEAAFSTSGHSVIARYSTASKMFYVGTATTSDQPLHLVWIALYEGSYTVDTLPDYVPYRHSEEYVECLRFFYRSPPNTSVHGVGIVSPDRTVALIPVELPVPMRVTPSINLLVAGHVRAGGTAMDVQEITVRNMYSNVVLLAVTVASELPANTTAALVNASFELDARL